MHEPVIKRRPIIDLEEFERRLRQSFGNQTEGDPLAELARLIDGQPDSFQRVAEPQGQRSTEARQDTCDRKRPDAAERLISDDFASVEAGLLDARPQGATVDLSGAGELISAQTEHVAQKLPLGGDFGTIEARLLGAPQPFAVMTSSEAKEPEAQGPYALQSLAGDTTACQAFGTLNDEIRSRRRLFVMAAIIIVGIAGIGASFGFRSGSSRPPEIAISENGLAKPQLEETNGSGVPSPDSSILGGAPQPSPGAVVNNAARPADPLQLRETMPAVVADDGSSAVGANSGLATEPARIAASPEQIETQADPSSQPAPIGPKKMSTASVGQNDAILSGDMPPGATAKIVPMPVPRPAAVAKASTRKTAARAVTPKARAKLKPPVNSVTPQPMQAATTQGGGREPDPLGDLLRGLFGGP
jgi:hypothetical protein